MGSTYLSLTNKVLRRLNEVELTSGTFASASGFHAVAKDSVVDAIGDIQQAEIEWPFNHSTDTITLATDGTTEYALAADAQAIDWESFHMTKEVPTSDVEEKYLSLLPYDEYLKYGLRAKNANYDSTGAGKPDFVVPSQNYKAIFYPGYSDAAYTVDYEYWGIPTEVSAHDDTTTIPSRFDYIIVQRALWACYMFHDNDQQATIARSAWQEGLLHMRTLLINKTERVFDMRDAGRSSSTNVLRVS